MIKVLLVGHRALTLPRTLEFLMIFGIFLLKPMKPRFVAIRRAVLVLTLRVAVVRPARVTVSSKSKCISYRMFMFLVKFVMEDATTVRKEYLTNLRYDSQ